MSHKPRIVVVGAGVSGLTSALELARTGKYDVAVVAKHMPGDYDIEYASPWAGADYLPVSKSGTPEEQYDRNTWPVLEQMAKEVPEAGIHFQETLIYYRQKDADTPVGDWIAEMIKPEGPWFKEILPNFHHLTPSQASPFDAAIGFTSVVINVSLYLPYLNSQLLSHGVALRRGILSHLAEARDIHPSGQPADLIVNCTGLSSYMLPGVEDKAMYPARAQIVIVRNEPNVMVSATGSPHDDADDRADEITYVMQRPGGGGTILGGCFQKGNWSAEVDEGLAGRIMRRSVNACPRLVDEGSMPRGKGFVAGKGVNSLSVVRHAVGLRPCREGGIRLEAEIMKGEDGEGKVRVVHNYGHGGYGYQSSYGCAKEVVRLVEKSLAA